MIMKNNKWFVVLAAGLWVAGNWNVMAEKGQRPSPEERQAKMQERFAQISEALSLTADQQAIFKAQREKTMEQMRAIHQNDSLTREEKKEQMQGLKESSQASLSGYLTGDQLQKMEEMRAERQARREEAGAKKGKKEHCQSKAAENSAG